MSDLIEQLEKFDLSEKEAKFSEKISILKERVLKNIEESGPSLLYVIWHNKTQSLLRSLLFTTIQTMLARYEMPIHVRDSDKSPQNPKTQMANCLGNLLR